MEAFKFQSRDIEKTHRLFGTRGLFDMRGLSIAQRHGVSSIHCPYYGVVAVFLACVAPDVAVHWAPEARFTCRCTIAETQCSPGPSDRC